MPISKGSGKKIPTSVGFTKAQRKALQMMAEKYNRSISEVVAELLNQDMEFQAAVKEVEEGENE